MTDKLQMVDDSPWYKEGLSFQCTECGKCCTGSPGYVWVTEKEIQEIADHLKLPVDKFSRRYLRQKEGRYALVELKRKNYDCIFLNDNKCSIYSVRPTQCRTYPWWQANLNSREAWESAAKTCEGIRDEASKVPLEIIERELAKNSFCSDAS
jgi:uncharacterized protein